MALLNVEEEMKAFECMLDEGYYSHDRSQNNADDYTDSKEERDTQAVHDFVNSPLFDKIISQI